MFFLQVHSHTILLSVTLLSLLACSARHVQNEIPNTAKRVVFVIGADKLVGRTAVSALSSGYGETLDIRAGVPDPDKAKSLKKLPGVTVVQAEFGKKERLRTILKGVSALYLTSPSEERRVQLVTETAQAAKEAGVEHILLYSLVAVQDVDTLLGEQYAAIERAVSGLGVPFTVLRLSLFMDNFLAFVTSIKEESVIYWPVDPNKPFTPVAMRDAAAAAASVLVYPGKHAEKTYTIVSDRVTFAGVAEAFSTQLHRPIRYDHISYKDAEVFLMKHGFSERNAKGIVELYRLVDAGSPVTNQENLNDFTEITGYKPTPVYKWVMKHAFLVQ